ncbi:hypothetical protein [Winogradskyella thalassocola]|uniref:Histidine kinase-, DNA gyrase B-, and HSP90-like ATPase n=1 Tax=Winogradskyella thalassocola TaxID=262004 RepID=A0A1G7ZML0_9FLAO|nr:hypothetical protein [Winogradskyella thalassocola]SDH09918.1 hypothetical protein SAMN04489796_1011381 [Winogradskyella thalassocola]
MFNKSSYIEFIVGEIFNKKKTDMSIKWQFAEHTELNDIVGFKDNDIEKFGVNPAKSIVREAIQNSCDALDINNGQTQVEVVIKTGTIKKSELPNFSAIEGHIKSCVNTENDEAENKEIQRHIEAFSQDSYSYLEISDYNTTGMGEKPFQSLTQGIFKSTKATSGSQGSKGVGKAAYYASSYLRTMLVSTRNDEGNRYRGAAKLSNHVSPFDVGTQYNYKGFYGDLSVKQNSEIPSLFQRDKKGTSVFVIGFWDIADFRGEVIREVLRNYWFAIAEEQLIVRVEDETINAERIEGYINFYFRDYRDYKSGHKQNPRSFFEVYKNGTTYTKHIANIGNCKLWLHKNEAYNLGAVARFRQTKMLIFKENDLDAGFAGIFLCDNTEGNAFLKNIENDAHDTWNPNLNHSVTEQAKITLGEIKEFIREKYILYSGLGNQSSFNIDALDNLFSFSGGNIVSKQKKDGDRIKPEPSEDTKDRLIGKHSFKAIYSNGKYVYRLIFNSKKAANNQRFKISIGTDSSKDVINITNASNGRIEGNTLELDVKKGENIVNTIELDCPYLVAPSITTLNK